MKAADQGMLISGFFIFGRGKYIVERPDPAAFARERFEMNFMRSVLALFICLFSIVVTGCSNSNYFTNRRNDLADIATIGVGVGLGAKGRVGPLQTGLLVDAQLVALRGGEILPMNGNGNMPSTLDIESIVAGVEVYDSRGVRGKSFEAVQKFPFVSLTKKSCPSYYTNIEVAIDAIIGIRLGVNPGEVLDFILGFTTIDIFNDDR